MPLPLAMRYQLDEVLGSREHSDESRMSASFSTGLDGRFNRHIPTASHAQHTAHTTAWEKGLRVSHGPRASQHHGFYHTGSMAHRDYTPSSASFQMEQSAALEDWLPEILAEKLAPHLAKQIVDAVAKGLNKAGLSTRPVCESCRGKVDSSFVSPRAPSGPAPRLTVETGAPRRGVSFDRSIVTSDAVEHPLPDSRFPTCVMDASTLEIDVAKELPEVLSQSSSAGDGNLHRGVSPRVMPAQKDEGLVRPLESEELDLAYGGKEDNFRWSYDDSDDVDGFEVMVAGQSTESEGPRARPLPSSYSAYSRYSCDTVQTRVNTADTIDTRSTGHASMVGVNVGRRQAFQHHTEGPMVLVAFQEYKFWKSSMWASEQLQAHKMKKFRSQDDLSMKHSTPRYSSHQRFMEMAAEFHPHDSDQRPFSCHTWIHRMSCWQRMIRSPMSLGSIMVDMLSVLLVMYDCVTVPLMLLEYQTNLALQIMTWFSRIFWTVEIPRAFTTGYLRPDGSIEMQATYIAETYFRTWFLVDLAIVTADWIDAANSGGAVRFLRILKATRLARMVRVPNMIFRKFSGGKAEHMLLWLSVVQRTVYFLYVMHFFACLWYGIGNITEDGWVSSGKFIKEGDTLATKYAFAAHWAASQFAGSTEVLPTTDLERAYGGVVLVFAFIWSAAFVSKITSTMTRLHILSSQAEAMFSSLRSFCMNRGISDDLASRAYKCAAFRMKEKESDVAEEDVELLSLLSEPLMVEIHYEMNSHVITQHPFFRRYNHTEPQAVQSICHSGIFVDRLTRGDILFTQGQDSMAMLFAMRGTLLYMKDAAGASGGNSEQGGSGSFLSDMMHKVEHGMWVCEPVLWMPWVHEGTLRAASNCTVMALSAEKFREFAQKYRRTPYPAKYAIELTYRMNQAHTIGSDIDDLLGCIDVKEVATKAFPRLLVKQYQIPNRASNLARSASNLFRSNSGSLDGPQFFGRRSFASRQSASSSEASTLWAAAAGLDQDAPARDGPTQMSDAEPRSGLLPSRLPKAPKFVQHTEI